MSIVCWVDGHYTEILLVQRCSRLGQGWFHPPSVPWPHQSLVGPSMLPRCWETGFIMAEKMRQVYCYTWYTKHPWMLLIHQSMWMSNGWSLQQWGSAFFWIYSLRVPDPIPLCMPATNINHPKLGDELRKWMWVGGTLFCFSPWIADDRCKLQTHRKSHL